MQKIFAAALFSMLAISIPSGPAPSSSQSSASRKAPLPQVRIVGYYASWDAHRGHFADAIRGELLTHVNYAFAKISDEGTAVLGDSCLDVGDCLPERGETAPSPGGNFAHLHRLKESYPHLQILIAIGGWTWSENFSNVALTPNSRERFVASALELFLDRWPGLFDGFDLDWEYPVAGGRAENTYRPDDWENYALLIAEFRRQLDRRSVADGRGYLLTIAAPAVPQGANVGWSRIGAHVNWINLMTYDYHTGGNIAHFNAPLYAAPDDPTPHLNVHATVQRYLDAGVPREQIAIGLPFFGQGYGGVAATREGLFQAAQQDGLEDKNATQEWGIGAVPFRQLRDAHERSFRRFWHSEAQVPWLFNPERRVWISYDDSQSLGLKSDYVRKHNLGGVMIWELGGDDGTLLEGVHRRLNSPGIDFPRH